MINSDEDEADYELLSHQNTETSAYEEPAQEGYMESSMDYEEQLTKLKHQLECIGSDGVTSLETAHDFNCALENTRKIILESFAIISTLLESDDPSRTASYLLNAIAVLQLLTAYLKQSSETAQLTCDRFHALPGCGAQIIHNVFSHCRASESMYGEHLGSVEAELKQLFGGCHQLQLVYLDVLQNRFTVQRTDDEVAALVEALNTNIDIGVTAVQLDVRSMAAQWKAVVALCERYSSWLEGAGVAGRCVDTLAALVVGSVRDCVADELDQKLLQRSLKVTSFLMKIIIKMCQIFKCNVTEDYSQIVQLLITLKSNSELYLRTLSKPEALVQQLCSHVTVAAEALLAELLADRAFALALMQGGERSEEASWSLGRLLALVNVAEGLLARDEAEQRRAWLGHRVDDNLVCCILGLMPQCHVWLTYGLRVECRVSASSALGCGAYEYVLGRACALAATSDAEQYAAVERGLLAALLREDCWAAMLAADLWVALARYGPPEICVQQVSHLIDIFKSLKTRSHLKSPQLVYFSSTIRRLFNTLSDEHKMSILEEYPLARCPENVAVWAAVGVRSLPGPRARLESSRVFEELGPLLDRWGAGECDKAYFVELTKHIALAATCVASDVPTDKIVQLWQRFRVTHEMRSRLDTEEACGGGWQRLAECELGACALIEACCGAAVFSNEQLLQIFDVLASIIAKSSSELKINIIRVLSSLACYNIPEDVHTAALNAQVVKLFKTLITDEQMVVKAKALTAFELFCHHTNQESIILNVVANNQMKECVINFIKNGELVVKSDLSWMEQLIFTSQIKFTHKCTALEPNVYISETIMRSDSNFEMPDVDALFDESNIEFENVDAFLDNSNAAGESAKKKIKLDSHEVESVLGRLERDAVLLEKLKENILTEHSVRICNLTEKLQNIVH